MPSTANIFPVVNIEIYSIFYEKNEWRERWLGWMNRWMDK